jgi:hypothetical protein
MNTGKKERGKSVALFVCVYFKANSCEKFEAKIGEKSEKKGSEYLKRTSESHVKRISVRLLFALKRKIFFKRNGRTQEPVIATNSSETRDSRILATGNPKTACTDPSVQQQGCQKQFGYSNIRGTARGKITINGRTARHASCKSLFFAQFRWEKSFL